MSVEFSALDVNQMLSERRFQAIVHALLWRESPDGLQICLHQRQRTGVMDGYWVCPGGRLVLGERPAASVRREIREELGVELVNPRLIGLLTFAMPTRFGNQVDQTTGVNYVFATNCWRGEAYAAEPHLHSAPMFFGAETLPDPHPTWVQDMAEHLCSGSAMLMKHYTD